MPTDNRAAEFEAILAEANIQPLWDRYHNILPPEPTAPDAPMLWRWEEITPFIDRAAADVSMKDAERRVLMLINPGFEGKVTTTTNLFAGIQILEPGESARPHRHTPSAMRFIMEGCKDGFTMVNGQRCEMLEGDLILTPNWAWHEHINESDKRVVWLDALDVPLAHNLGTVFSEGGRPNEFDDNSSTVPDGAFLKGGVVPVESGTELPYSPMFRYPWTATLETFTATPASRDGSKRVRYTNPMDGGPVITTLDSYAWEIRKDQATAPFRTTANAVFLAVDGAGVSQVGDKTIEWNKHDVFTVPHWNWTSHKAVSETAHLFMFTDREVMRRLHFLREETQG